MNFSLAAAPVGRLEKGVEGLTGREEVALQRKEDGRVTGGSRQRDAVLPSGGDKQSAASSRTVIERAVWHGWANADVLEGRNLLGVGNSARGEGASPRRAREEQSEWPGSRGRGSKAARVDRCGSVVEWVGSGSDIAGWKASEDKTNEQRLAEWRAGASSRTMVSRALVQATEEWLESDPATRVHWE